MPVSDSESLPTYKVLLEKYLPKSVFDIGVGYGNIGNYTKKILPNCKIYGVEIFAPYLNYKNGIPFSVYDSIILGDIIDLSDKLWKVDLISAFDVIEHLERQDGIKVIKQLQRVAKKGVIVTVPIIDYPQGEVFGNIHETHLTQWKVKEMEKIGGKILFKGNTVGLFYFKHKL